jgi:hypothetical protein
MTNQENKTETTKNEAIYALDPKGDPRDRRSPLQPRIPHLRTIPRHQPMRTRSTRTNTQSQVRLRTLLPLPESKTRRQQTKDRQPRKPTKKRRIRSRIPHQKMRSQIPKSQYGGEHQGGCLDNRQCGDTCPRRSRLKVKIMTRTNESPELTEKFREFFSNSSCETQAEKVKMAMQLFSISQATYYRWKKQILHEKQIYPYTGKYFYNNRRSILDKKSHCYFCGNSELLVVHHKDFDRTNENKSNYVTLCSSCHRKLHFVQNPKIELKILVSDRRVVGFENGFFKLINKNANNKSIKKSRHQALQK